MEQNQNQGVVTEVPVVEATAETVENSNIEFSISVVQKDEDGNLIIERGLKFALSPENAVSPDAIVGTMFNRLFDEMDKAKAFKAKFLSAKHPIQLKVSAAHVTIDYGKVEDYLLLKLKANSSARSKLALLDRCIILTKSMLQPIKGISAVTLAENLKIAAQEKAGREVKRLASSYHDNALTTTVLAVTGEPALN